MDKGSFQQIALMFDDPAPESTSAKQPATSKSTGGRGRKNKQAAEAELRMVHVPPDEELFQKLYYSIGEVATMLNVKPSLLRYWETEFSMIQPRKNKKGDRFYRPEDIKTLQMIQFLLREKKFTVEGAKTYLKNNLQHAEKTFALVESLRQIKAFLQAIKADL